MIISLDKNFLWEKIIQFCSRCGTQTVHALSKRGDYYSCGCGEKIDVEIKDETE